MYRYRTAFAFAGLLILEGFQIGRPAFLGLGICLGCWLTVPSLGRWHNYNTGARFRIFQRQRLLRGYSFHVKGLVEMAEGPLVQNPIRRHVDDEFERDIPLVFLAFTDQFEILKCAG